MTLHLRQPKAAQGGFVLVVAALLLAALIAAATVAVQRTRHSNNQTARGYHESRAFYVAEGGSATAQAWLINLLEVHASPTQTMLDGVPEPEAPEHRFVELSITRRPRVTGVTIPTGPYAGMTADIVPFEILSHAENDGATVDGQVKITIDQRAIGMYQFGIFYEEDLEIFPTYPLDYHGRIHTNGNLYLGSHDVLNIDGSVTAAGHIYNTPKDPTMNPRGKARVSDLRGQWHDLSYDSRDPDWIIKSLDDWDGKVLDSSHAYLELPYPLPTPDGTIQIIQRGQPGDDQELRQKRFYYKAQLRILDGVAFDTAGNTLTIPPGVLTASTVYDYRERRDMAMTNVNIGALIASGLIPDNRIVYISNVGANAAIRLVNGAQLPSGGLTIATDNPLYIWGNYNTVNKKQASILCDAFNVYSVQWTDANSTRPLNQRIARQTYVNTCVVAGDKPTVFGQYSGGAENLIRLHEKWVGHELVYRGSLVCIWESQRATGDFRNASYIEAHRDWGFDRELLDPAFWPEDEMALRAVSRSRWEAN